MSPRAAVLLEELGFEDVWDYTLGKVDWLARGLTVEGDEADRMTVGVLALDPPLLRREMSPSDAVKLIDQHEGRAGVVIADDGIVVGLLTRDAADKADGETVASVMELGPKTYRAGADPADALDHMIEHGIDHVIVSEPEGKLIGLLYRDIVLRKMKSES